MNSFVPIALILLLLLCASCSRNSGAPSASSNPATATNDAPAQVAKADSVDGLAGHWTGNATIIVNWVKQRQLPVVLEIAADGSVTGAVGDAKLVNGRVIRNHGLGSRYRVHGDLEGALIAAEDVTRKGVDIPFHVTAERTIRGGVHSSGSEFGGKESMKLSAGDLVLRRDTPSTAAAAASSR
jgi:hypothetical protein